MKWFLYVFSITCIAIGCSTILYTHGSRNVVKAMTNHIDRKILSVMEAIVGVLLLFSATASYHSWIIRLIGFMAIIEGVIIFCLPRDLYDELVDWYLNAVSDKAYRLFGIISLIFGVALLSWIF